MVNVNHRREPAVYALHTGDHRYFYVGATRKNSQNRLYQHVSRALEGHSAPVYVWMRTVGVRNVQAFDLESITDTTACEKIEAVWIQRLIREGHPLTNRIARDGVPHSVSRESVAISSATRRGKPTWIKGKRGEDAGWTDARRAEIARGNAIRQLERTPEHGTAKEYVRYGCRCYPCRKANAVRNARNNPRYLRDRTLNPCDAEPRASRSPQHGTSAEYKHHACRCEPCCAANREYYRAFRARHAG